MSATLRDRLLERPDLEQIAIMGLSWGSPEGSHLVRAAEHRSVVLERHGARASTLNVDAHRTGTHCGDPEISCTAPARM